MAARRQHHDVFFRIVAAGPQGPVDKTRRSWEETAGIALQLSVKTNQAVSIFVLVATASGAEWYAGSKGVERYVWLRTRQEFAEVSHVVLEQIAIHCAARRSAKLPPKAWIQAYRKLKRRRSRAAGKARRED